MANNRLEENDAFRVFLKNRDSDFIDKIVFGLNAKVEKEIDCTECGACCKSLMINVTAEEADQTAGKMNLSLSAFKEKYIEESIGGKFIINTIPCHFLKDKKCTIYEDRFNECREFPHLHKPNFSDRLFGTLIHYSICPIIFNVVEQLKIEMNFKTENENH